MNCEQALELLSSHLDGANTPEEEARLQAHLDSCPACRAILDAYQAVDQGIGALTAEPPAELHSRVMDAVRQPQPRSRRRFAFGRGTAVAAVVAVILLAAGTGYLPTLTNSTSQSTDPAAAPAAVSFDAASADAGGQNALLGRAMPSEADASDHSAQDAGVTAADAPTTYLQELPPELSQQESTEPSVMTAQAPAGQETLTEAAAQAFPDGVGMPELLVELTDDPAVPAVSHISLLEELTASPTATERAVLYETDTGTVRLILTEAQQVIDSSDAAYAIVEPAELLDAQDTDPCGLLLITP